MKFSIVIPVRSTNAFLLENLEHLQRLDHSSFEVIVVTDSPEESPVSDSRIRYVSSGPLSPGEKRNLGASASFGEYIAFLDDDAFPTPSWLSEAERVFSETGAYALGGPASTPPQTHHLEKYSGKVLESILVSAGTRIRHIPSPAQKINDYPTVNLIVRKESFEKVGGFTKEFWPGEDTKLCLDLVKHHKEPFHYSPAPKVFHHRRHLFLPHLKQISRYGMHRGQFAKILPETSRLPTYFIPSIFIVGLIFGPIPAMFFQPAKFLYFAVLAFYLGTLFGETLRIAIIEKDLKAFLYLPTGIFLTHVVYGVSFLVGLFKRPKLELRNYDKITGKYLGG